MPIEVENLHRLFDPRSVAVIGASQNPGKLGFHVMKSLTAVSYTHLTLPTILLV